MTGLEGSKMNNEEIKSQLVKVVGVYYAETDEALKLIGWRFCTGLVLELEDGRLLRAQSTDHIMSFEEIKHD